MPLKRVKSGWQFGNQKVFPTKAGAVAQMRAIKANQKGSK